jgi:hypothetical protein
MGSVAGDVKILSDFALAYTPSIEQLSSVRLESKFTNKAMKMKCKSLPYMSLSFILTIPITAFAGMRLYVSIKGECGLFRPMGRVFCGINQLESWLFENKYPGVYGCHGCFQRFRRNSWNCVRI